MGSVIAASITIGLSLLSTKPSDIVTFCKWLYSYFYIALLRLFTKKRFDLYDMEVLHDPEKTGFLPPQFEHKLESPQPESHLLHAADEVFFYGVNSRSEYLIVRIARSLNNEAEAWIYLKLKDGKIYTLHKTEGYQNSCSDDGNEFTCGGLKVHYKLPMRRWRIFYNGLLKETSEENTNEEKMVYVKFGLLWRASSDQFDVTTDVNNDALAMGFAKTKWKTWKPPIEKFNKALNFYAQSGVIFGTISVEGGSPDYELYLYGERMRFLGDTFLEDGAKFTHILGHVHKNGSFVHIVEVKIRGIIRKLRFGFMVFPTGILSPFSDADFSIGNTCGDENESISAVFHAEGVEFRLDIIHEELHSHVENKKRWCGSFDINSIDIQLNGMEGRGIMIKGNIQKPILKNIPEVYLKEHPKDLPYIALFSEELCDNSFVAGGKGSSLGKLTKLSKQFQNFIVPNGLVITTSAYESFITNEIKEEIRYLEEILYGTVSGDVKEACKRVTDEVVKTNIPVALLQAVVEGLQNLFGEAVHSKKFAIRSSATGEDTEQMSAAGQMETFLGVTGLKQIMFAVKKCWASQFGFVAVQYKRQNGQVINSPMAVVIQEMVPCDVAGVLFTCDPLTGNPSLMSITANYGLGESVVSGSEEPDTIVLERDEEDKLKMKTKIIGAKSHRIVIKEDEGTILQELTVNEKNSCCVSDAMALRLGNIALQIEKSYRSNRDIEWGFWNNNLYIFQSRPVTSGSSETDYEIDHEMDTAMRIENEYFTVSNIGEVMPGSLSPLGIDLISKFFNIAFGRKSLINFYNRRPTYFPKGFATIHLHAMFYVIDFLEQQASVGKEVLESTMIGLFGRILDDEEMLETAKERQGPIKKKSFGLFVKLKIILGLLIAGSKLEKGKKLYANYHVPVEKLKNSKDVFNVLMHACDDLCEALTCHGLASRSSSLWNLMIVKLLMNVKGGLTPEVYRALSQMLASISGVESADVPCAIQSLAFHIGKEISTDDFKKRDPDDAIQWLNTSPTEAGIKFRDFLLAHGHRCLKEFDLRSSTWAKNPKLLVQLLQNLVGNVTKDTSSRTIENFDHVLGALDISLKFTSRMLLKHLLLPQCRRSVQMREASKSLLIKQLDDWRKGYKYLAKLMVAEGRLPDDDLLFFMNLEEIQELLNNRSPKIISRAIHRRKRYPELDRYIFPEISKGYPKPINANCTPVVPSEDGFKMQGIPVSQGVTKGFVRVALTLEEASKLKPGEILMTYGTDIGWTPYFPTLAGVVTELGGLISHGAVVSREYGLPCIAGLRGATLHFQTGDYVLLDGNRGILQKIAPPQ